MAKRDLTVTITGGDGVRLLRNRIRELEAKHADAIRSVEGFRASYVREGAEHDATKRRVAELEAALRAVGYRMAEDEDSITFLVAGGAHSPHMVVLTPVDPKGKNADE